MNVIAWKMLDTPEGPKVFHGISANSLSSRTAKEFPNLAQTLTLGASGISAGWSSNSLQIPLH